MNMGDALVELVGEPLVIDPTNNLYHLRLWRYPEMDLVKKIDNAHKYRSAALTWSWDSKVLYTSTYIDRKTHKMNIKLWETESWQPIQHYQSGKTKILDAFFLPDNKHLFGYSEHTRVFQLVNCYTDEVLEGIDFPDASYPYAISQNPVKKNQFAFAFNTEIWIYEIEVPTQVKEN